MSLLKKSSLVVALIVVLFANNVFAIENEPNGLIGECYISYGIASSGQSCSWFTALDRDGTDGGHITAQFNDCYVSGCTVYTMEQGATAGELAVLFPQDIFVVWDEDSGHGNNTNFEFSGSLGEVDSNENLVQVSGDGNTNWKVYQVQTMGTLTITNTGQNEHDAFRLAKKNVSDVLNFWKEDGIDDPNVCLYPDTEFTYTVCWDNQSDTTYYDCNVIDYLPGGVDFDYAADFPNIAPNYNITEHSYNWEIGDIAPGDSNSVSITVTVNDYAEPAGELINIAELWATVYDVNGLNPARYLIATATKTTNVCCWEPDDPNIIYVDENAPLPGTGTSWQTAYTDLQDAIARINKGCVGTAPQIWVADGTYKPGDDESDTFTIPDGVKVYGGFGGYGVNETSIDQRNFKQYESILNGYVGQVIGLEGYEDVYNNSVITMGNNTLLDGFVVEEGGYLGGITGSSVTAVIKNCIVQDNTEEGIYFTDSNLSIQWCDVRNNVQYGIYHFGKNYPISINNCKIHNNQRDGVLAEKSILTIKNSLVYLNGSASTSKKMYYGINIGLPSGNPEIYNNTIIYNTLEGINYTENDPNDVIEAYVTNNILWYNNDDGLQYAGQDPNRPYLTSYNCSADVDPNDLIDDYYNISSEPDFAYFDDPDGTYNFHIAYNSPCVDAGDSSVVDVDDVDMDYEERIYGTNVDIGADEAYSCDDDLSEDDIFHPQDWYGADGFINLNEFNEFSQVWLSHDPEDPALTDPNLARYSILHDPNDYYYVTNEDLEIWNPIYNLDATGDVNDMCSYVIDIGDLAAFAEIWLWEACWHESIRESLEVPVLVSTSGTMSMSMTAETATLETASFSSASLAVEAKQTTEDSLEILNSIWDTDEQLRQSIDQQQWDDFIGSIEDSLY